MYAKITMNHVRDITALILTSQDEAILFHEPLVGATRFVHVSATLGNATLFVCQMPLDRFTEWRNTERPNNVSLFEGRIDLIP